MIKLVGLDGSVFYLNYFQILCIELIPETKVLLCNGRYYLVRDSIESVQEQIRSFLDGCVAPEGRELLIERSGDILE